MIEVIRGWFLRYFSDPEAVVLALLLCLGVLLVVFWGGMLAPIFASIVLAYLLETWINLLERWKLKRLPALLIVYFSFLGLCVFLLFVLIPLVGQQFRNLFNDLPNLMNRFKELLYLLPERFPEFVTKVQLDNYLEDFGKELHLLGKAVLSFSLASIPGLIAWLVYLILVPIMIFFFLKDKQRIVKWFLSFLPDKNLVLSKVWVELNAQIGNYIQGKITEIILVGLASYVAFYFWELKYAFLLSFLVGLSVLIPYIGATVVTIPIVLVAIAQFGMTAECAYLVATYFVVQMLDGNLLVPILFSDAVNLHPLAIIVAILFFGGVWGFWGVFFAIPLATLVKAVLNAWPKRAHLAAN